MKFFCVTCAEESRKNKAGSFSAGSAKCLFLHLNNYSKCPNFISSMFTVFNFHLMFSGHVCKARLVVIVSEFSL